MEQPVICVIVPVYKAEATLPRCIESVLTQQLPGGLRLILVDDQSPDRSGEICDAYAAKDPRVMVLHRRERGVSGARNVGLRAATGEYIVFLDSDDALRPGALAAALAAQAAAPSAFVLWHYTMQPDDTHSCNHSSSPGPTERPGPPAPGLPDRHAVEQALPAHIRPAACL